MIRSSIRLGRAHKVNGSCLSTTGTRAKSNDKAHYNLVKQQIRKLDKNHVCYCFNEEQKNDIINGFDGLTETEVIDDIIYIKEVCYD